MKNYRLYLIRHGVTQGNLDGIYMGSGTDQPLCAEGVRRLQELAARFAYPHAETVFSSPMRRAVESGMTDDQIQAAAAVRSAMTRDADGYRTQHTGRVAKMAEFGTAPQKKTDNGSMTYWYVLMAALVMGLVVVLGRRRK